ncbi:MAG: hypothetical protein PVJ40_06720 [Gammaproteobacteria bacterium]|jgi:hypothetical protein
MVSKVVKARLMLLLLATVFMGPLAVATLWYYGIGWQPSATTNQGQLVDPPRPLPHVALPYALRDGIGTRDFLHGHWSIVYVGQPPCSEACIRAFYIMAQTELHLGKDMSRVRRYYLVDGIPENPDFLKRAEPGLTAFRVDNAEGQKLLQPFRQLVGGSLGTAHRIYLVDPLGNLMMSYPEGAPPKGLLKDLKHLLKLSNVG